MLSPEINTIQEESVDDRASSTISRFTEVFEDTLPGRFSFSEIRRDFNSLFRTYLEDIHMYTDNAYEMCLDVTPSVTTREMEHISVADFDRSGGTYDWKLLQKARVYTSDRVAQMTRICTNGSVRVVIVVPDMFAGQVLADDLRGRGMTDIHILRRRKDYRTLKRHTLIVTVMDFHLFCFSELMDSQKTVVIVDDAHIVSPPYVAMVILSTVKAKMRWFFFSDAFQRRGVACTTRELYVPCSPSAWTNKDIDHMLKTFGGKKVLMLLPGYEDCRVAANLLRQKRASVSLASEFKDHTFLSIYSKRRSWIICTSGNIERYRTLQPDIFVDCSCKEVLEYDEGLARHHVDHGRYQHTYHQGFAPIVYNLFCIKPHRGSKSYSLYVEMLLRLNNVCLSSKSRFSSGMGLSVSKAGLKTVFALALPAVVSLPFIMQSEGSFYGNFGKGFEPYLISPERVPARDSGSVIPAAVLSKWYDMSWMQDGELLASQTPYVIKDQFIKQVLVDIYLRVRFYVKTGEDEAEEGEITVVMEPSVDKKAPSIYSVNSTCSLVRSSSLPGRRKSRKKQPDLLSTKVEKHRVESVYKRCLGRADSDVKPKVSMSTPHERVPNTSYNMARLGDIGGWCVIRPSAMTDRVKRKVTYRTPWQFEDLRLVLSFDKVFMQERLENRSLSVNTKQKLLNAICVLWNQLSSEEGPLNISMVQKVRLYNYDYKKVNLSWLMLIMKHEILRDLFVIRITMTRTII